MLQRCLAKAVTKNFVQRAPATAFRAQRRTFSVQKAEKATEKATEKTTVIGGRQVRSQAVHTCWPHALRMSLKTTCAVAQPASTLLDAL